MSSKNDQLRALSSSVERGSCEDAVGMLTVLRQEETAALAVLHRCQKEERDASAHELTWRQEKREALEKAIEDKWPDKGPLRWSPVEQLAQDRAEAAALADRAEASASVAATPRAKPRLQRLLPRGTVAESLPSASAPKHAPEGRRRSASVARGADSLAWVPPPPPRRRRTSE